HRPEAEARHFIRVLAPKLLVEELERPVPVVSGRKDRVPKVTQRKHALAREYAVAVTELLLCQRPDICHVNAGDLTATQFGQLLGFAAAPVEVEEIDVDGDRWVIGSADQRQRIHKRVQNEWPDGRAEAHELNAEPDPKIGRHGSRSTQVLNGSLLPVRIR